MSFGKLLSLLTKLPLDSLSNEDIDDSKRNKVIDGIDNKLLSRVATESRSLLNDSRGAFWDELSSHSISPASVVSFCRHILNGSETSAKFVAAKLYLSILSVTGSTIFSIFDVVCFRNSLNLIKTFSLAHDTQGFVFLKNN